MRVELRVAGHEVDAGGTGGDAIKHGFHVFLLDMRSSLFEAVVRQHLATRNLAVATVPNALVRGCGGLTHGSLLVVVHSRANDLLTSSHSSANRIPYGGIRHESSNRMARGP